MDKEESSQTFSAGADAAVAESHHVIVEMFVFTGDRQTDKIVFLDCRVEFLTLLFIIIIIITIIVCRKMAPLINKDPRLFGPGPVRRVPAQYYGAMKPLKGFSMCATHGIILGMLGGLAYKVAWGDPSTRTIEEYYKENPPK